MTAKPIKKLLEAMPAVGFTLHFGNDEQFKITDPESCFLDDEDLILYLSIPVSRLPETFVGRIAMEFPATVEVIDLRLVRRVTVNAERMPG
jgi:hypothetical protein